MAFWRVWRFTLPSEKVELLDSDAPQTSRLSYSIFRELAFDQLKHEWAMALGEYDCVLQSHHIDPPYQMKDNIALIDEVLHTMRQRIQPWSGCEHLEVELTEKEVLVKNRSFSHLSLVEVIKFCPGRLKNDRKNLLLLMKVLTATAMLHQRKQPHLGLTLDNIFVDEQYAWFLGPPDLGFWSTSCAGNCGSIVTSGTTDDKKSIDISQADELAHMTMLWCIGKVTNFDYLMFLNKLAGRKTGDPSNSVILPWVTSFSSATGDWRDLTKSKYHITKGEDQLNANFKAHWTEASTPGPLHPVSSECYTSTSLVDASISELFESFSYSQDSVGSSKGGFGSVLNSDAVATESPHPIPLCTSSDARQQLGDERQNSLVFEPHHLLDMMPNLAYYTYMARRTPKQILTQYVRPIYQPHEFPSSMARLYETTPEECIPEFFTDPTVFKSIHSDMPDLGLPAWCATPEDFITYHRSVLESEAVSSMLHHWIDLTFGYKLLGGAAIASKNVHLEMAGLQTSYRRSGVTCLFRTPHPRKLSSATITRYFGPTCPIFDCSSPVAIPQDCLRSHRSELHKPPSVPNDEIFEAPVHNDYCTQLHLPADYNPLAMIDSYAELCRFLTAEAPLPLNLELPSKPINLKRPLSLKSLLNRDLEAIGCLAVELFTHSAINYCEAQRWSHTKRLQVARANARLYWDRIPSCLHSGLRMILDPFGKFPNQNAFQNRFLPTIHQLLYILFEFPPYMYDLCTVQQWLTDLAAGCESAFPNKPDPLWGPLCVAFSPSLDPSCSPSAYTYHIPVEVLELLDPYLRRAVQSAPWWLFDALQSNRLLQFYAAVGGVKAVEKHLLPLIMSLYQPNILKVLARRYTTQHPISVLCSRRVLQCLLTYVTPNSFLSHLPALVTLGVLPIINSLNTISPISDAQFNISSDHQSVGAVNAPAKYINDSRSAEATVGDSSPSLCSLDYAPHALNVPNLPCDVEEIGLDLRSLEADCELFELFQSSTGAEQDPPPRSSPSKSIQSAPAVGRTEPSTEYQRDSTCGDQSSVDVIPSADNLSLPAAGNVPTSSTNAKPPTAMRSHNNSIPPVAVTTGSVVWLAKRIGPILTAKHIVPHLLAALVVAYTGDQFLASVTPSAPSPAQPGSTNSKAYLPMPVQTTNRPLMGDSIAAASLRCLEHLVRVYGVCFVLHVYLPYVQHTISTILTTVGLPTSEAVQDEQTNAAKPCPKLVQSEWNVRTLGKLVASLTLLHQFVTYIPDSTLSDYLRDSTLQDILHKSIRISGRLDNPSPCGSIGRLAVLYRVIDCIYVIGLRVGFEMTRSHMYSLFQVFFALFDRVAALNEQEKAHKHNAGPFFDQFNFLTASTAGDYGNLCDTVATHVGGIPSSEAPPKPNPGVLMELCQTFTTDLARLAYIPFCRLAGGAFIDSCIYNTDWIQELVHAPANNQQQGSIPKPVFTAQPTSPQDGPTAPPNATSPIQQLDSALQELNLLAGSLFHGDNAFHLRGTWCEVFQQEMDDDYAARNPSVRYHATRLASFTGHNGRINCIDLVNTENSFVTASQDRTVQLWSLSDSYSATHPVTSIPVAPTSGAFKSFSSAVNSTSSTASLQGFITQTGSGRNTPTDQAGSLGNPVTARLIYRGHKRPVFAAVYLDNYRLVASCDGHLILWDPWTGQKVRGISSWHSSHLSALTRCPCPHGALLCADVNGTIRLVDPRMPHSFPMTNPLHFFSGSLLAGSVKDRPRVSTTHISKGQNDLSFDPITLRLAALTSALHNPKKFLLNQTDSTPQLLPGLSSAGTLTRLTACEGSNMLLCGFTSGFLTTLDLRQFQVLQAWQAHTDTIIQLGCTSTDWFVSTGDRSLAFWRLTSAMGIQSIRSMDHVFARGCTTKFGENLRARLTVPESCLTGPLGISSVSQFATCKDELVVCGPTFNPSGSIPAANVPGMTSSPNDPPTQPPHNSVSTPVGSDLLGVYRMATHGQISYQPLGRIPLHYLRGRVTTLSALSLSGLFLMGSNTGAISLLY